MRKRALGILPFAVLVLTGLMSAVVLQADFADPACPDWDPATILWESDRPLELRDPWDLQLVPSTGLSMR